MVEVLILLIKVCAVVGGFGGLCYLTWKYVELPAPLSWVKSVICLVFIVFALLVLLFLFNVPLR